MGRRKIDKTADSHSKKIRRSDSTKKESMKCRKEIRLSSSELETLKKQAELQRLNNEINHIGVNINQITHNNNSRLYSREDKHRLYVFMKGLKELLQQVIEKL